MAGERYQLIVVGAGAAGMTASLFAARHGLRVLLVEAADVLGGTFHLSSGQMSAAGTRLQARKGIVDSPACHFDDVMRISRNTVDPDLVRLAVDNAADTLHWLLDLGLEVEPDQPVIHYGHEPYTTARTCWAPAGGRAILDLLGPEVERCAARDDLTIITSARLLGLETNTSGVVVGVSFERDGIAETARADRVLLCTGGFSANPEMFEQFTGKPLHGGGYAFSQGDGLTAALAAGARLSGGEHFLPSFAGVPDEDAPGGVTFATQTYPQFRQPSEIYVDGEGRRFMREDDPSVDARERALLALPGMSFWAIFDARTRRDHPGFFLLDEAAVAQRFETNTAYRVAQCVSDLAAEIEVDPAILGTTLDAYNDAILHDRPDPFGRLHRPVPIAEAPFFAVRHVGWSIVSFAGIDIDTDFRVLDLSGRPISGLYAAGEIIGFAKTSGNSFCGGMSVTPAMTFGRLAGLAAARDLANFHTSANTGNPGQHEGKSL